MVRYPVRLVLASPAEALPTESLYTYEPELDGWRDCWHGPRDQPHSRTETELTARFPGERESIPGWTFLPPDAAVSTRSGWCR